MEESRHLKIEIISGDGDLERLKTILGSEYTQEELDIALCNAIAYSRIEIAEYLLTIGANLSSFNNDGLYYAAHNNEINGVIFCISKGIDINVCNGMLLNTSIYTAINTKNCDLINWLLSNGATPKLLKKEVLAIVDKFGTDELKQIIKKVMES